jgi:hypothetical protein
MNTYRKNAIIIGVLFIIGTVAGVLTLNAGSIISGPDYLNQVSANENQILIGAGFVLIMGFALSMMSVVLYPVINKHNEVLALGAVVFRGVLEAFAYMIIVVGWLLLITISRDFAKVGALDVSYYQMFGTFLRGLDYWMGHMLAIVFTLGALMIYYVLYQSRLIPRLLAGWGFIGAILYFAAPFLNIFDPQLPSLSLGVGWGNLMWPLAVQEMVFALWLIVKGFNPSAIASASA